MLVTGGTGFLGRHLTGTDASRGWEIYAPGSRSMDIRDDRQVLDEITDWRPSVVVHLAHRKDDRKAIVDGTAAVAAAAARAKARLVHMSTDVVFRGGAHSYNERDLTSPITDYGAWKAKAEELALASQDDVLVVRTSLLYGTSTIAQIQHDVAAAVRGTRPMRFFTDEIRCPAHARDVADAIAIVAGRRDLTGVLHVAGPQAVTRAELARRFARWMGLDPDRVPVGTRSDSPVPRAGRVVLDCERAAELGLRCRSLDEVLGS